MESLMDMGFSKAKCELALKATGNQGTDTALDWLLSHPEVSEVDDNQLPTLDDVQVVTSPPTGDAPDNESLSEEELARRRALVEEKIKQRRLQREQQEQSEAVEKERRRMNDGKSLGEARRVLAEREIMDLAEQRRREKMEDKLARQRVREQIEADKQARREKLAGQSSEGAGVVSSTCNNTGTTDTISSTGTGTNTNTAAAATKKEYKEARIQFRLMDGSVLTHTFTSESLLSHVRDYVTANGAGGVNGDFCLGTTFPRRIFSDQRYDQTLHALGLTPSAVVIVSRR